VTAKLKVYKGRENVAHIVLKLNGQPIPPFTAKRAVLRFGPYCLDTDVDTDIISMVDDGVKVRVRLGLLPDLSIEDSPYIGFLTVFDDSSKEGLAWDRFKITVVPWGVCGEDVEDPCGCGS